MIASTNQFEFDSMEGVQTYLSRITTQAVSVSWNDFLKHLIPFVEDVHQKYFDAEAGPDGNNWEPWYFTVPSVMDHPTLFVTGRLRGSMLYGGDGNVTNLSDKSLEFGTSVPYGFDLNYGGVVTVDMPLIGRDGRAFKMPGEEIELPPREFVGLNEEAVDQIVEWAADEAVEQIMKGL